MAMNKKEQAEFEAMKRALIMARALNWTAKVDPDIAPPKSGGLTTGYLINAHNGTVDVGCSSSVFHGRGQINKTTTQRPVWLYSTRLLALKAVRHEVEKQCANRLADIDEQIAAEVEFLEKGE